MQNHLKNQTSPYLLQHVGNPVDWYPWCKEAFEKAKAEDKPIFLSIGYSTCHWCHVMAHESFEDEEIAKLLNENYISIKVDKEERPDIDSVYMSVCQTLTGSGGWPTTIFMTPEQKPFFAGTYFPKTARYGHIGFKELLLVICKKWKTDKESLLEASQQIVEQMISDTKKAPAQATIKRGAKEQLLDLALRIFKQTFDKEYGGFGAAPKFPSPHNLLFLMDYYTRSGDKEALDMVEKTLLQMYRGGIYDHIGGGFSRYSTDRYFLVPHFEKMLYDNAMLVLAYCKAYEITKNVLYRGVAEKTAQYVMREMTSPEGGFYSAQDADSKGVEGLYYLFEPIEVMKVLGRKVGQEFCKYFDITKEGNFEGKSIPNLLKNGHISARYNELFPMLYEYRKKRYYLHLDDKLLTSWNGLMIGAMCHLYRITENEEYLVAARKAQEFIDKNLSQYDVLFTSFRQGVRSKHGFLDDYANEVFGLLALYQATLEKAYLEKAQRFSHRVIREFEDKENGGFFLYGSEGEQLVVRPKESYDGAIPSGNSMMAYNLVQLYYITGEKRYGEFAKRQLDYMTGEAKRYPAGYAMFLIALQNYVQAPDKVVIVLESNTAKTQQMSKLSCRIPLDTIVHVLERATPEYPLKDEKTTYYVCKAKSCFPPSNELEF